MCSLASVVWRIGFARISAIFARSSSVSMFIVVSVSGGFWVCFTAPHSAQVRLRGLTKLIVYILTPNSSGNIPRKGRRRNILKEKLNF